MSIKNVMTRITNTIKIQKMKKGNRRLLMLLSTSVMYIGGISWYLTCTQNGKNSLNRMVSRTTQFFSIIPLPPSMRSYVYGKYAAKYGVDLEEMDKQLEEYRNFSDFFTRGIKKRAYVATESENLKAIGSPCDGQILFISKITGNQNTIIKDITYSLSSLLYNVDQKTEINDLATRLKRNNNTELHQVILYLCPGDYHRFHAPYEMIVDSVRTINGQLRPVNIASLVKNGGVVYEKNARKVMQCAYTTPGSQTYNYLGMVLIGALNVGKIALSEKPIFSKCQQVGYFNLGSTIVLILQLNSNHKWCKKAGQKIKYGEKLCEFV